MIDFHERGRALFFRDDREELTEIELAKPDGNFAGGCRYDGLECRDRLGALSRNCRAIRIREYGKIRAGHGRESELRLHAVGNAIEIAVKGGRPDWSIERISWQRRDEEGS